MTLRLNGSTSGYTEIDAPAVAGNNNIQLPAGNGSANQFLKNGSTAGTLGWSSATEDSSGNFAFNSGYGSVATAYGCRAWVNFDGTTASPSTRRGSGNVSSVTKNGTGDYTINFTTALPDGNYSVAGTPGNVNGMSCLRARDLTVEWSSTACRLYNVRSDAGVNPYLADSSVISIAVFR